MTPQPASNPSSGLTLRANASWAFLGHVVHAACWFSMTIVLARLGSPEHVGRFALGLATAAPVFMLATLRLRDVQATDARGEFQFGDYLALRLATTGCALLVVGVIVLVAGFEREAALVVLATAVSKAIEAVSDALYGLFMQHERLDRVARSMMLKGPLSLLGLALGVYLTGSVFWGVVGLALARLVVALAHDLRVASISLAESAQLVGRAVRHRLPRPHWDRATMLRLARLSLPLGIVTMLISLTTNIPRYFVEGHLGAYQLGIFAAVASFQKVAPTAVQAVGRSAAPRLARYFADHDALAFRKLTLKLIGAGVLLGVAGVGVALLLGRELLTLFYGAEYAFPALFALLMLAAGVDYVATMLVFVITSARYFRIQLPLQILATSTVAVTSWLLIPGAGLKGAAVALVCGGLVRALGALLASWHAHRSLGAVTDG